MMQYSAHALDGLTLTKRRKDHPKVFGSARMSVLLEPCSDYIFMWSKHG